MKTNGTHEVIARIAGQGLVLGTVLALMLSSSIAGRAQASATSPAVPAATPATVAPVGQPAARAERRPGGNHEGITVHGHWIIEVRNPDGKLVSHTEFENGLALHGGGALLAGFIGRVQTPGSWYVLLEDSTGNYVISIAELSSAAAAACSNLSATGAYTLASCSATPLSISTPNIGGGGPSQPPTAFLTLTGSAIVPAGFPSAIQYVETDNFSCAPTISPQACFASTLPGSYVLTQRILNGAAGTATAPVSVAAGQTVSVTVTISFAASS